MRQLQKISSVHLGTVLPSILVTTLYIYPLKDQNATSNVTVSHDSSEHCTVAMQCSTNNDHTALCTTNNWYQRIKKFPKLTCIQTPMLYCQRRRWDRYPAIHMKCPTAAWWCASVLIMGINFFSEPRLSVAETLKNLNVVHGVRV